MLKVYKVNGPGKNKTVKQPFEKHPSIKLPKMLKSFFKSSLPWLFSIALQYMFGTTQHNLPFIIG